MHKVRLDQLAPKQRAEQLWLDRRRDRPTRVIGHSSKTKRLRELLHSKESSILMEAHSGLSAKLAEEAGSSVKVEIRVRCPGDIERVEVCRNNHFIYVNHPAGRSAELTLTDREPLQGRSYYYVRVVQKDEEIAWSSPVWFGTK